MTYNGGQLRGHIFLKAADNFNIPLARLTIKRTLRLECFAFTYGATLLIIKRIIIIIILYYKFKNNRENNE